MPKANWHLDFEEPDDDPFESHVEVELDITTARIPELEEHLEDLNEREGKLASVLGTTCPIKGRDGVSCSACPIYEGHLPDAERAPLCRLGRRQERVTTQIAVLRDRALKQ